MTKRLFDIVFSTGGLVALFPVMAVCALLVKLTSSGPVLFRQQRIGKRFIPFEILKFRSMVVDAPSLGGAVTADGDPRITKIGRVMRKTKLDELPQLVNVLRGDMSFVGPRPEVLEYVDMFRSDYEELLTVRPGITDISSLTFRFEEEILAAAPDPREAYISEVLPAKIKLSKTYLQNASIWQDVKLIVRTLLRMGGRANSSSPSGD